MLDPQISALLAELGYDPKSIDALVTGSVYLTIVAVLVAVPTGFVARRKGRSVTRWVIFALIVPVLPLLVVSLLPSKKGKPPSA
jgi:amino acid transporter